MTEKTGFIRCPNTSEGRFDLEVDAPPPGNTCIVGLKLNTELHNRKNELEEGKKATVRYNDDQLVYLLQWDGTYHVHDDETHEDHPWRPAYKNVHIAEGKTLTLIHGCEVTGNITGDKGSTLAIGGGTLDACETSVSNIEIGVESTEQLKSNLQSLGLKTGGTRQELIDRFDRVKKNENTVSDLQSPHGFSEAKYHGKDVLAKRLNDTRYCWFYYPTDQYVYFSPGVTFESPSDPNAGQASTRVLILVAKDHEYQSVLTSIKEHAPEWKTKTYGVLFKGRTTSYYCESSNGKLAVVVAAAYCQGQSAVKKFSKFVKHFDPNYVMTVGCCAGARPAEGSSLPVYIITEAVTDSTTTHVQSDVHPAAMDAYRCVSWAINFKGRPDAGTRGEADKCRVITTSETVDDSGQLDHVLNYHSASCLDMEVFCLFNFISQMNESRKNEGEAEITLLPAFKGYSDHASKEERERNLDTAVSRATFVAVYTVRCMLAAA